MNEKDLEFEPEIGGDGDCVFERCEKCGNTYGESVFDDHECEPEQEEDIDICDFDKEEKEAGYCDNSCEIIWCEPVCPKCGKDEGKCDYDCSGVKDDMDDLPDEDDLDREERETETHDIEEYERDRDY